jgi:nucleotide-binding universal stress UspA family protein
MIKIQRVLVATDFTGPSQTAMGYGRTLARAFGGSLHVIHVVENVFMRTAAGEFGVSEVDIVVESIEDAARKQLDAFVSDEDLRELNAQAVVCNATTAASGIVSYAKTNAIDLIVMGTHGGGAFSKLLTGSVAERVIRTAPCAVLTVHHPETVAPDPSESREGVGA